MSTLTASALVRASLAEAWGYYFDPRGWPAWVDGFGAVEAVDGYPSDGGTLTWRSVSAGRGRVTERVLEHQPRQRHRIAFNDPESRGELLTEMAVEGEGTRVALTIRYRLARGGPFAALTDVLFVRPQVRRSLERTLARFAREIEGLSSGGTAGPPPDSPV
jgi:uncharacterized membrane protein